MSVRSEHEIRTELGNADATCDEGGCPFSGMSYTEGVQAALDWVLGNGDAPMSEG